MKRSEALDLLHGGFIHTVKDPLWGNIPMTEALKNLLETDDVEKLSRIKQNGPAYHIYPGAVHTRLNHSLGVYHLGREILLSVATKAAELPLTATGIFSFLAACLLHDIGHFPYAHSLKELALREHEEIAADLILRKGALNEALAKTGASPEMTAMIIAKDLPSADWETSFYRNILSGTLDPDKLDYLTRDAFFAGIPYGKQDTDYIISSLSFADGRIVLDESALSSVEQVLFSKYMMYRNLYWHKGVRSATCMIKKALLSALRDGYIEYDDLYIKDDYEFHELCRQKSEYSPFSLIEKAEHGILFERKYSRPFNAEGNVEKKSLNITERFRPENMIYEELAEKYPDLREYEVIIDIPEPISFETDIAIRTADGSVSPISSFGMIFQQAGSVFSKTLRMVALYLPHYVAEKDAMLAFEKVDKDE